MTKLLSKGEIVTITRTDSDAFGLSGKVTEVERTSFLARTPQSIKVELSWPGSTTARSYRFSSEDVLPA